MSNPPPDRVLGLIKNPQNPEEYIIIKNLLRGDSVLDDIPTWKVIGNNFLPSKPRIARFSEDLFIEPDTQRFMYEKYIYYVDRLGVTLPELKEMIKISSSERAENLQRDQTKQCKDQLNQLTQQIRIQEEIIKELRQDLSRYQPQKTPPSRKLKRSNRPLHKIEDLLADSTYNPIDKLSKYVIFNTFNFQSKIATNKKVWQGIKELYPNMPNFLQPNGYVDSIEFVKYLATNNMTFEELMSQLILHGYYESVEKAMGSAYDYLV